MSEGQAPRFAFIECVRGYAGLLVIICHTTYLFPELPYPLHRVTVLGWHGVQLFFLASAVTLMMSWRSEQSRNGSVDVAAFFLRRFFRIAPAYYCAVILYFWVEPPAGGWNSLQAAATCLFINAWHPVLMGVTENGWPVVPGSWSISVEFTFYAAFPFLARTITSLPRAVGLVAATLVTGATVNTLGWPWLHATYGFIAADNFIYFWFFNQMSVFALGLCLFYLLDNSGNRAAHRRVPLPAHPNMTAMIAIALAVATAFVVVPHWLMLQVPVPPRLILVSVAFMIFIIALARSRSGLFVNAPAALFGRVSFSAYLLHPALLTVLARQAFLQDFLHTTGWTGILAFGAALTGIVLVILGSAWCTYRVIELPMINLGKALIRRRRVAALQRLSLTT